MADTVIMPKLGFDMAEGTLVRWIIGEGQAVKKGAVLAEIETDKATVEVESTFEGIVARHLVSQGTVVPVNTPIALIAAPGEVVELPEAEGRARGVTEAQRTAEAPTRPVAASPLARRMAAERGLDLSAIAGSGPGGRIVKKDIESFLAVPPPPSVAAPLAPPVAALPPPPVAASQIPLTKLRAMIGRRMVASVTTAPHFFITHEYDAAPLVALRKQVNALLPEAEKITINDFAIKAVALTLREFPNLNASLDVEKTTIVQHEQVNIGVAVALEAGLLTVVCREADRKPLRQIASEVRAMVGRAREGKVRPEDIEGSTFSVSNLGMFEVEQFNAIINPPEAGILAVGAARATPVVKDGQVVPGVRLKATLSVDHRVSDGAEGARFLQALAKYLEEPLRLLV